MKKLLYTIIAIIGLFVQANAQCPTPTLSLALTDTTIAFKQDSIMLDGGAGFTTYTWSTGANSRYIWVKNSAKINLTVTNSLAACGKDSTVVIFVKGIQQKDTSICAGKSLNLYTPSSGSIIPNNGLVAWYPFNGNANDESGNGNNGTVNGANLVTGKLGNTNTAYLFNGTSNNISLVNPFLGGNQNTAFTFHALIYSNSINSGKVIWSKTLFWGEILFSISNLNEVRFFWANSITGNKYSIIYSQTNLIQQNQWYDIVVTYQNSVGQIYLNGLPIVTNIQWSAQGGSILSTSQIEASCNFAQDANSSKIGSYQSGSYFNGKIDEFGIWNRALSLTEIQALYSVGTNSSTKVTWSTNDTTNSISVAPSISTTYRCTQRIGSFTMTDSVRVTVNALPIINSLPDTTIAFKQDSILLNAGAGYSKYVWSRGDTTQSIWVKTPGMNKVTVFNSSGCSNSDSTNVIFVKGIQQKDTSICAGSNLKLSIPSSTIPGNGLVGYWPFTGNANDASGNGNNGTVNGATLTSDRNGTPNNAYNFNYANWSWGSGGDEIFIPFNSLLNTPNLTVSVWAMRNSAGYSNQQHTIINRFQYGYSTPYGEHWQVLTEPSPSCLIKTQIIQSAGVSSVNTGPTLSLNNWFHIVMTYDGSSIKQFINGNLYDSIPANGLMLNVNGNSGISIGVSDQANGHWGPFDGKIDDIGIWNRALTPSEIQALYSGIGGNANTKITWSTSDTTNSITSTPTTSTTYRCTQRIGSFTMTDSVRVTVIALPIINSLPDTTIAFKQDSILLNAGAGYSKYVWSRGDTTQSIWVKTAGINKVTVFNSSGCSNSDSTRVLFVKGIQQKDTSICAGKSINLSIPSGIIPTNGLVGYWPFTGNANDASGNGNNGTVNGSQLTNDSFGNLNTAYSFNTNSHIYVPFSSSLNTIQSGLTMSSWIYMDGGTGSGTPPRILELRGGYGGGGNAGFVMLSQGNSNTTRTFDVRWYNNNGNTNISVSPTFPVSALSWHHVAFSCDGLTGIGKFYMDGVLLNTNASQANQGLISSCNYNNNGLFIGAEPNLLGKWGGKIDELVLHNRALSAIEIQALYSGIGGNANTKVTWSTTDTTNSISVTPTTSTTYRSTQRIGSFTMIDSVRVTVNALPIINSLPDTTIAFKQDSLLLNAGVGYSKYVWSRGDTTQSIWVKTAGINKVTVFNSSGCSNSDSTRVLFVKGIQQKDTSICAGKSINLSIPSGIIPTNGLVGYWPFTGNANDASGNGNNGTVNGSQLTNDSFGNLNTAYSFNTNSHIYVPFSSSLNTIQSGLTMSSWIYMDGGTGSGTPPRILELRGGYGGGGNAGFVMLSQGNSNTTRTFDVRWYNNNGNTNISVSPTFPVSALSWHHVAFSCDGLTGIGKFYMDGVLLNTNASQANQGLISSCNYNNNGLFIGAEPNLLGKWGGKIDELVLHNRALSAIEIQALYSGIGGNANTKVTWSTTDTTNSISVAPSISTTYRCTQRIGSFTMIDSVRVTVNALPIINSLPDTTIAFKQDSLLLNAGVGYSKYVWSRGDTTQSIWVKTAGINKVTVFNSSGCSNSDSTRVLFVKGILIKDTSVCTNTIVNISATNIVNSKYLWSTGDTVSSIVRQVITDSVIKCTYKIGTFTKIDSIRITSITLPIINSLPDTSIAFKQDSILLNAGAGFSKYLWSRGDTTQSIWVKTAGMNKVTVFNSAGCSNSDSTNVIFVKGIQQKDTSICAGSNFKLSIPSSTIPSNGLVGYWPFSGNAYDASGNGNNGTVNGATLTTDRNGNVNSAYSFDGNDLIQITNWDEIIGNSPFSINFWVKAQPYNGWIIAFGISENGQGFACGNYHWGTNQFGAQIWKYNYISDTQTNLPDNGWNLMSITYVSNTLKTYKNGSIVHTQNVNYVAPNIKTGVLNFGQQLDFSEFFNGDLDDIGFWNRALTPSEIQALYSGIGGNANTKITWSTSDTTNSISVTPTTSTTYRSTQRIGSFTMTDSIRVTVRNLPSKTINCNKKGLCKNDTISINVLPGYAYNWYKNNIIIAGTNNTLKAFANGNYKAKLTDSTGCTSMSDSVTLFNAPLPKVNMSLPDTALCLNGNIFKFTDSTTLDSGSFNRNWTFGNGNTSILSTSNQSYTSAGIFTAKLKVTTNYGCADSTIKNITVKPNPIAGVMLGQVINLISSTPYIYTVAQQINHLYNWVVTNGIVVLGQSTNAATVQWISNGNGYIKVEVTNQQGCLDTTALATKIGNVGMNETSDINNLSLYPNPNHGSFTVGFTLKESSATKLELINMLGQQVWGSNMQLQNGEQQIPINLSLSAGVYVLKITTSTGEITKQVLVK